MSCAERVGNVARNTLRPRNRYLDIGLMKNTRFLNDQNIQFRLELFNATNTRNFGIPEGRVNRRRSLPRSSGRPTADRRIWLAVRYIFLANDDNVQGLSLRPLDLPARIIPSSEMPLQQGTRLGLVPDHECDRRRGKAGEVYRARDQKAAA